PREQARAAGRRPPPTLRAAPELRPGARRGSAEREVPNVDPGPVGGLGEQGDGFDAKTQRQAGSELTLGFRDEGLEHGIGLGLADGQVRLGRRMLAAVGRVLGKAFMRPADEGEEALARLGYEPDASWKGGDPGERGCE